MRRTWLLVSLKKNVLIHADENASTELGAASAELGEESADVWTKVSFSVGTQSDRSSTTEAHVSASANLSVGGWSAKVQASTSVSSSSKEVQSQMSSCRVDGSFSAMVCQHQAPLAAQRPLPELPRGAGSGGLTAPPNTAFRIGA